MKQSRYAKLFLVLFAISACFTLTSAYDDLDGIELNDVVDFAFIAYRNGEFVIEYTASSAFRIEVNTNGVNDNFVNAILGMKVGETKSYITWTIGLDVIEYYNTTIIHIELDASPETTPSTSSVDFLNSVALISIILLSSKIKHLQ
ncbi:MAG: hypothetical protein ACTSQF_14175 [Candidatus Heimdallarchaeaceae archaeon]